jgi:hypothetical protein
MKQTETREARREETDSKQRLRESLKGLMSHWHGFRNVTQPELRVGTRKMTYHHSWKVFGSVNTLPKLFQNDH